MKCNDTADRDRSKLPAVNGTAVKTTGDMLQSHREHDKHTDLAKNVIHKLQEDLVHIKVILGTGFAEAHTTYPRGKL